MLSIITWSAVYKVTPNLVIHLPYSKTMVYKVTSPAVS